MAVSLEPRELSCQLTRDQHGRLWQENMIVGS
jgi:hypothetical protein